MTGYYYFSLIRLEITKKLCIQSEQDSREIDTLMWFKGVGIFFNMTERYLYKIKMCLYTDLVIFSKQAF